MKIGRTTSSIQAITVALLSIFLTEETHAKEPAPNVLTDVTAADVIVYGSTPGGVCAAIAAAREGASVILLEPTDHVGAMSTGGLSHCDSNQMVRSTLMGLFDEWHTRVVKDYTDRGLKAPYDPAKKDQSKWTFEPHVAMRVTMKMLDEAGVTVLTERYLKSVTKEGPRITSLVTKNGTFTARVFVDGTYEGDLMAAAGVDWTIGREGRDEYGESLAPGKQAYVSLMRERHNDIATFNEAYETSFDDWQSLVEAEKWRLVTDYGNKVELADNAAFLSQCVGEYHRVARTALLKADPNHLFFGDKLGARSEAFDTVIEAAAPYVDVIQFGHYGRLSEQVAVIDRWTNLLKIPFISADGSFSVRTEMLPFPMGQGSSIARDYPECSAWTRELAAGLFARPDVVGWNICGVIDVWKTAHGREKKQHQGIMDPFGKIHPGMELAIRDVTSRLYHIADSQNSTAIVATTANPDLIGREGFVHVERKDGIWFMVNAEGERFVPAGMNHVGPLHRFAPYNRAFWLKQFGSEVFTARGQIDWKGPGVKRWLDRIALDHKDNGFNTLAFHHPLPMPTEYCNELELYYFGKMKMSHVHARRAKAMGPDGKLPDVFDPAWRTELDAFVEKFTSRHKDAKYLLGYCYEDLPAYTIHHLEKRITEFEHHPWVIDIISKPGLTQGKQAWIDVLKEQYAAPAQAGEMYGLSVSDWDDFGEVTAWGLPKDSKQGFADQAMMNARIVEAYLKAHYDALRKHDPNHLIFGDKIQNARPQPDWVWKIVSKYVDVVLIQDYDFFTPGHERKLRHIHNVTGKPIINGDHSYGVLRPNMLAVKGVKVASAEEKGQQYATYLRGIMNLPFMLGWQTCGYLETWKGTTDSTGKQQTGYFDPFGEPIKAALSQAKAANEQAIEWHKRAGTLENVYSNKQRQR